MLDLVINVAYLLARYLHEIATTLLVGGTLFYVLVVPGAIAELKEESRLAVFARARWMFRWIVFGTIFTLLVTGALMTARSMWVYRGQEIPIFREIAMLANPASPHTSRLDHPTMLDRPAFWFAVHVALGLISIVIAIALVRGGRPPHSPLPWMRLNFVLLLLVILMAAMSRNARMRLFESVRPESRSMPPEVRE